MSATDLVEALAEQHDAHLRWLRSRTRGRLAADEVEDVLQAAYARALAALSAPGPERPDFASAERATAWLRTIAFNGALDLLRHRRGRSGDGRTPRPPDIGLDDVGGEVLVAEVDVEAEAIRAVERESLRRVVVQAVSRIDERHRQILQLRYGRDLPPAAIMVLVGLDRRQWEGRHTRALKAFGRALARASLSSDCRDTRRLLKASPAGLLQRGGGASGDHIASCLGCSAFANAARFAMSALPLPLAIEAWRLDAVEVLAPVRSDRSTAVTRVAARPKSAADVATISPAGISSLAAAAGAMAAGGAAVLVALAMAGDPTPTRQPAGAEAAPPAGAEGRSGTRLASHLTPRQTLERAARETGRRRARSASRAGRPVRPESPDARSGDRR